MIQVGKYFKDMRKTSKIVGEIKHYAYLFERTTLWAVIIWEILTLMAG
jgi:hypothetical protein